MYGCFDRPNSISVTKVAKLLNEMYPLKGDSLISNGSTNHVRCPLLTVKYIEILPSPAYLVGGLKKEPSFICLDTLSFKRTNCKIPDSAY